MKQLPCKDSSGPENGPSHFANPDIDNILEEQILETDDDYEPTYTGLYDTEGKHIIIYPELGTRGPRIV